MGRKQTRTAANEKAAGVPAASSSVHPPIRPSAYLTMLSNPATALPRTNDSASLAGITIPVTA